LEIAEISKYLSKTYLVEFVKKLDSMEIFPLDSFQLKETLKKFGINIRMIGELAKISR
jgi:hypothetical protein